MKALALLLLLAPAASAQQDREDRILFIGDSHSVGIFGRRFDADLRGLPRSVVRTAAVCGSHPESFFTGWRTRCGWYFRDSGGGVQEGSTTARTPLLEDLLRDHRPNLTVVALGANLMGFGETFTRREVARMARTIRDAGSYCAWIGPPDGSNKTEPRFSELYRQLQEATQYRCQFIDSRPLASLRDVHCHPRRDRQLCEGWADSAFRLIFGP